MAPESSKTDATSNDGEKQKNLDQEVRELISALTTRLSGIQRSKKSRVSNQEDDEEGVRIITLAGSNLGATMRGDVDEKAIGPPGLAMPEQEDESASYLVNSNFQAINNSIMIGGSYKTNDPGVHLDISDYVDQNEVHKNGKKGRKNKRGTHKSDNHVERSENDSDTERS